MVESGSQNKTRLSHVVLVTIVLLVIIGVAYFLFSTLITSDNKDQISVETFPSTEILTTNFPISVNDFDMYAFNCFVEQLITKEQTAQNGMTILIGAECTYLDLELKPHTILVPLIVRDSENNHLASNKFYSGKDYSWTTNDYLNNISRFYYLDNEGKENYDDPHEDSTNYFSNPSAKKPTISQGDMLTVSFALEKSSIYFEPKFAAAANFFKEYHQAVTGYEKIEAFLKDGKEPNILFTEGENWIIPTWVTFSKDKNL